MYFRSQCAAEQHVCEVTGKKTEMWFEPTIDSVAGQVLGPPGQALNSALAGGNLGFELPPP